MFSSATKTSTYTSSASGGLGATAPNPSFCGSSTQISDLNAYIIHHIEYMPYGENFFEMRDYWGTDYKFNSKPACRCTGHRVAGRELDSETGLYYYGARYHAFRQAGYTPELSVWLSVDPMARKYPSLSPYAYVANNPITRIDPDGREIWIQGRDGKRVQYKPGDIYRGTDDFVEMAFVALDNISLHSNSKKVVDFLANDNNHQIIIEHSISGRTQGFFRKNFDNDGLIKEQYLSFNPNGGIVDRLTMESFAPFIGFFHELGHFYSAINNYSDFWERRELKCPIWIDREEQYNIETYEVPLARYFNMLQRTSYTNNGNYIQTNTSQKYNSFERLSSPFSVLPSRRPSNIPSFEPSNTGLE